MSVAEDLNVGFTVAAMNPRRGRDPGRTRAVFKGAEVGPSTLDIEKMRQLGFSLETKLGMAAVRLASLEHQAGMYRAFRRADGVLLHSHEFKGEVIRRAERDGYIFTLN